MSSLTRNRVTAIFPALASQWRNGWLATISLALISCTFINSQSFANNVDGAWTAVHDWPLIGLHAVITPDGRVLSYGTKSDGKQTGFFIYDVWDPAAGLTGGHMTLNNMTQTDIFCSSQLILPQSGDILITGGDNWTGSGTTNTGNNNSNIFDYGDNTLARSANMNRARWYSSATALLNGEIYIQGGTSGEDHPEVRQPDGSFRLLSNADTSYLNPNFPRNFIAPDGRVFGFDAAGKMYFVDAAGTGSLTQLGNFNSNYGGWQSSAAMFEPGKILQIGTNQNGALIIDINGPQPVVQTTQSLSSRRKWVNATVLPDGKVLATGGSNTDNQLDEVNNFAEIWDPATGQWHQGAEAAIPRLYHSMALLLPDASVLVGAGGAPGPLNNTNMEIYYPPYLYDDNDNFATRPEITDAPDSVNVGDQLNIIVDTTAITRVTLVQTGSVTHSVNMGQRFVELPFTASGTSLTASLPVRASDTPPGFYHMFVFNADGVPSVSSMLRINIDNNPNIEVDFTPTIGGNGGQAFQLACAEEEVLAGVHGRYENYVHQIGAQCVRIDQLGRWIGDPVDGPITGTRNDRYLFSKTCPRDYAMSGFRGRADQYVNQLEIECRALTPAGGLTGDGQFLGGIGGNGGNAQDLQRCGTDNPVYALYGRSGGWIDSIGVQCRTAPITPISINSTPVVVTPGTQTNTTGDTVSLQINATDGDNDPLTYTATNLPDGLNIDTNTGLITGIATTASSGAVGIIVSDGAESANTSFTWIVNAAPPLVVNDMEPQPAAEVNAEIVYTADVGGGQNTRYAWDFGDGTPPIGPSESPTVSHSFSEAGIYFVTLTVTDDLTSAQIQAVVQAIHEPLTANAPASSSQMAYESRATLNDRVWAVNPDNDSISVFDAVTNTKLDEISVGTSPRATAIAPDGRVWVSNKKSASISVVDAGSMVVMQTFNLPAGSQPHGIVFSPVTNAAYVALVATGELLKLDATTGDVLATANVGLNATHLAINGAGDRVYVSRFITPPQPGEATATVLDEVDGQKVGGEVLVVAADTLSVVDTIILQHSAKMNAENQGSGVPNYLGAAAIAPDGRTAWVPSKQDNLTLGTLRNGVNINFQNTVRAISSRIDLSTNSEDYLARVDHDNSSLARAAAFDPVGVYLFVALETSREVAVMDAYGGYEMFKFNVGFAPQALAVSPDGSKLFVSNFMSRSISIFDLTELRDDGQWNVPLLAELPRVANEKLSAQVLLGKKLFYDARDTRLAMDKYMSCASCHSDGGQDGRVWDLTGMGEGLRNTISLAGTGAAHGFLHWSANFDEVQDFEGQIRGLAGGTGLMDNAFFFEGDRSEPLGLTKAGLSSDLDALAAYVASLSTFSANPNRAPDGSLTPEASLGRAIFRQENCAACHAGEAFSDSTTNAGLHDIGTLKSSSGSRLGGTLAGIETPTLRGAWATAPYLHDGSALTLADAIQAHNGVSLETTELNQLVRYVMEIDASELTAPQDIQLQIDINPASATNEVNPGSTAPISVTLFSSGEYDALQTDVGSLRLGSGQAQALQSLTYEQSNDDAPADLVVSFSTQDTGLTCTDTEVVDMVLTGESLTGETLRGVDFVTPVECVEASCHP